MKRRTTIIEETTLGFSYKVYAYTHEILQTSNAYNNIICIDADERFS